MSKRKENNFKQKNNKELIKQLKNILLDPISSLLKKDSMLRLKL